MLKQVLATISEGLSLPDTDDPEIAFKRAQASLARNDWATAIGHLSRAVKLKPLDVTFNLALSLTLFLFGEILASKESFAKTIILDEKNKFTPKFENISDFKAKLFSSPQVTVASFFHGSHAPERQVFMSAALGKLEISGSTLRILEIGSYAGASLLTWVNAAHRLLEGDCIITCIDPWGNAGTDLYNDSIRKNLKSTRTYEVFCHNASLGPENIQILPIRGTSANLLPTFEDSKFDLIYIDGSHHYADVLFDIVECSRLLRPGGIICGDDLELQLSQCDSEFIKRNKKLDYVRDPKSGEYFHPGVTLAVGEYFGGVSCFSGFWAMQSTLNGFEKVSFREATGVRPSHWQEKAQQQISTYFERSEELGHLV
jgi:predicted O-methyltransferase YrrM